MNWQFWKKQESVSNKSKINIPAFLLNEKPDNSFSYWNKELSYSDIQYCVISQDTTPKLLSNYGMFTLDDNINSSIETEIQQMIEAKMNQAIMKNKILENLHETLDNLHKECEEEGFETFSETAKKNAQQILNNVYEKFSNYEYYIYPTENREIAIDCNPYKGKGVLILCDSDNGVACFATLDGKNHRFRYDSIDDFPYDLLWKTFGELDKKKKYFLSDNITHISMSSSSGDSFSINPGKTFEILNDKYECA